MLMVSVVFLIEVASLDYFVRRLVDFIPKITLKREFWVPLLTFFHNNIYANPSSVTRWFLYATTTLLRDSFNRKFMNFTE
jgi:hypothetical protein